MLIEGIFDSETEKCRLFFVSFVACQLMVVFKLLVCVLGAILSYQSLYLLEYRVSVNCESVDFHFLVVCKAGICLSPAVHKARIEFIRLILVGIMRCDEIVVNEFLVLCHFG
ncbi:unknown [Candidatus Apopatosoma intestinale]|nr:unknown [Candidatus Apopatosoma intestinale]